MPTRTNTTIADHGHRQQKLPPSAPHETLRSVPTPWMDWRQPPEQADEIFWVVEGVYGPHTPPMLWRCIITGTKERFEGHIHPHPPKIISACLGGCHPSIQCICAVCKASCGLLGGNFCRQQPRLWQLWHQLCVVVMWPEPQPLHFGPMETWHIGYCRKVLNVTKTIASLYWGRNVGINWIERYHCWPHT